MLHCIAILSHQALIVGKEVDLTEQADLKESVFVLADDTESYFCPNVMSKILGFF